MDRVPTRRSSWTVMGVVATALLAVSLLGAPHVDAAIRDIADGCPAAEVPADAFADVTPDNVHKAAIDCVAWWKVTLGTTATTYSPGGAVTRAQMASFIARMIEAVGSSFPANPPNAFTDDEGDTHEANINKLAAVGIVQGTGPGKYRPAMYISREQMASLLARSYEALTRTTLPATPDEFTDDESSVHEENINKIAAAGFTGGTSAGRFSPIAPVFRDAMASFLARMLDKLVEDGFTKPPTSGSGPRPTLPVPSLPTTVPLPTVPLPTVPLPTVPLPTVPLPTVPTVPLPTLTVPTVTLATLPPLPLP